MTVVPAVAVLLFLLNLPGVAREVAQVRIGDLDLGAGQGAADRPVPGLALDVERRRPAVLGLAVVPEV